jgi:UDP-N-acetylmuramyl pentapeptide phosphotransferase/UDP-N-acetylglucosamine-1-phosphate transferase
VISIVLFATSFVASFVGVSLFTRWSTDRGIFDLPNERSSHSLPTPRGGGLIIALVSLAAYVIIGLALGLSLSWGYVAGALLVAVVSWIDDLYSLPFWGRLIFHILAAGLLIWDVGFWSHLSIPLTATDITLGSGFGVLLTVVWLVWLLNAYNFMDGIDGLAALQAVISCVAWAVLASLMNLPSVFLFSGIVACASAGFLMHNWQPAKVFMGDVGSAFLGFTLAAMPLLARDEKWVDSSGIFFAGILFVWFFVFDTVFTLFRRLVGRQRVWEAHRDHIYQKLVIDGKTHSGVALLYGVSSAFLSATVILALVFSGIYAPFSLFSLLILTFLVVYFAFGKKR